MTARVSLKPHACKGSSPARSKGASQRQKQGSPRRPFDDHIHSLCHVIICKLMLMPARRRMICASSRCCCSVSVSIQFARSSQRNSRIFCAANSQVKTGENHGAFATLCACFRRIRHADNMWASREEDQHNRDTNNSNIVWASRSLCEKNASS